MNSSPQNYISIDEILSDVLITVGDEGMKMMSRGWYISQIQQALEELSFDTFFLTLDSFHDIDENLRIEMPRGAFNLKNVYGIIGSDCEINNSENIYFKKNFLLSDGGVGFTARDTYRNNGDAFHTRRGSSAVTDIPIVGMNNGILHFSPNCRKYDKIRLVYTGVMCNLGETPLIPSYFRQAVKGWVSVRALQKKCNDSLKNGEVSYWKTVLKEEKFDLEKDYTGTWAKAMKRASNMDEKELTDMKMYFQRFNY